MVLVFVLAASLLIVVSLCQGCDSSQAASHSTESYVLSTSLEEAANAWYWKARFDPDLVVCRLLIPKISVDIAVLGGTDPAHLEQAPGHWEETPVPGQGGHVVISGHRSTFGSPFLRLDELNAGDLIELVLPYGVFRYEVTGTVIVEPDQTDIVASRGVEELSLATCHPPGSGEYRMVVRAKLIASRENR